MILLYMYTEQCYFRSKLISCLLLVTMCVVFLYIIIFHINYYYFWYLLSVHPDVTVLAIFTPSQ